MAVMSKNDVYVNETGTRLPSNCAYFFFIYTAPYYLFILIVSSAESSSGVGFVGSAVALVSLTYILNRQ